MSRHIGNSRSGSQRLFVLSTLAFALPLAIAISPAAAKPDYNGLSDVGRATLQSFHANMRDCDPKVAPHTGENAPIASQRLGDCKRVIASQRKRLDRIKGADRNHPTFKKFAAYQKELEETFPKWVADYEQTKKKERGLSKLASQMRKDLQAQSDSLWFLHYIKTDKKLGADSTSPERLVKHVEALNALKPLAARCTGEYAAVLADKSLSRRAMADRTPKPKDACKLVAQRTELFAAWIPKAVETYVDIRQRGYQKKVEELKKDGWTTSSSLERLAPAAMKEYVNKQLAAYKATASKFEVSVAASSFKSWNETAAQWPEAIKMASKVKRPRSKASNGKVKSAFKKAMRSYGLKMVKLGLSSAQGRIVKRGALPLRKSWRGELLAKGKGDSFCRLYRVEAAAEYKGGGRYQSPTSGNLSARFQVSACR